jgi:hypothetical protein
MSLSDVLKKEIFQQIRYRMNLAQHNKDCIGQVNIIVNGEKLKLFLKLLEQDKVMHCHYFCSFWTYLEALAREIRQEKEITES